MSTNTAKTDSRYGFTIVEMIVVVAIISLLTALLFPAIARVRENGKQRTCASNLKQLGLVVQMYSDDNNGYFPAVYSNLNNQMIDWTEVIVPYVKNRQIYICPTDPLASRSRFGITVSYGINRHVAGTLFPLYISNRLIPKTDNQILRPAATVLMTDAGTTPVRGLPSGQWLQKTTPTVSIHDASVSVITASSNVESAPHARHSGKASILWVDGHVTLLPMEKFYNSPDYLQPGMKVRGLSPCLRPDMGCF